MSSKHTPGPWLFAQWGDEDTGEPEPFFRVGPLRVDGRGQLCTVRSESDARLIAAAPDLFEACEAAHGYLVMFGTDHADGIRAVLRAAMKKARGEP